MNYCRAADALPEHGEGSQLELPALKLFLLKNSHISVSVFYSGTRKENRKVPANKTSGELV